MKSKFLLKFELEFFLVLLFQPFADDYIESGTSSGCAVKAPKPKEVPYSEAKTHASSGSVGGESVIIESLWKEIKVLKAQCLTAINQSKKSSDREGVAHLQARESTEAAQIATAKLTQAMDRELYMLEIMTTASQELIGKIVREPPCRIFRIYPRIVNIFSSW